MSSASTGDSDLQTSVNCTGRCFTAAQPAKERARDHAGPRGPGPKILQTHVLVVDFGFVWLVRGSAGILGPVATRTGGESPCG